MAFCASSFHLKQITPEEFPKIREMATRIWPQAYHDIITSGQIEFMLEKMYAPSAIQNDVSSKGIHYDWLLREKDRIGFAGYGPLDSGAPCTLHKFYLETQEQGRGQGTPCMELLIREATSAGASEIRLRVNRHNKRAIRFYQKCGFEISGENCLTIGNGFVMDDFLMSRRCD